MLRLVLDTNVLVAARRSHSGASNVVVRAAVEGRARALASVALFLEYEAVLKRPEHRRVLADPLDQTEAFLDLLASEIEAVRVHYVWRPQLVDLTDEMVLETAINGSADFIVTFNGRHFDAAADFGVKIVQPSAIVRTFL